MSDPIDEILGDGGLMAEHLPGYAPRPAQVRMARSVAAAFALDQRAVIEAATGTGKTLAYLIPALLSGKRVVVSTATKALQRQLLDKDIPVLRKLFASMTPSRPLDAVVLKGRTNYLCQLRFDAVQHNVTFRSKAESRHWPKVLRWVRRTTDGDRASIEGLPDDWSAWGQLTASGLQCLGQACPKHDTCFVFKARKAASEAHLTIVNHHLFFADLGLRIDGFTSILPDYDAVIFDEAHHLEDTISRHFGVRVSNRQLGDFTRDLRTLLRSEQALTVVGERLIRSVDKAVLQLFTVLRDHLPEFTRVPAEQITSAPGQRVELSTRTDAALDAIADLNDWLETAGIGSARERLIDQSKDFCTSIRRTLRSTDTTQCRILDRRGPTVTLESIPISIDQLVADHVLGRKGPQIYTSATLTTGGTFDFFLDRLGFSGRNDVTTVTLPSTFDYPNQALLYVPRRLPAPNAPRYIEGACQIVDYLIRLTHGRAMVLCTSYRNLDEIHECVAPDLPFTVLKQGDAPRDELLRRFREDVHSVLFATGAFWEGVDVSGESLSLVILDKLPFPNLSEPVVKARMDAIDRSGSSSFQNMSLPLAAVALKQGFGRLIRTTADRGIVALLDSRVAHKRYGRFFIDSLPPCTTVWNAFEVRDWWAAHGHPDPVEA